MQILIFVDLLLDLFMRDRSHPLVAWVGRVADFLLRPARAFFALLGFGRSRIDWTPLFTIFALNFLEALLLSLYYG